MAVAIFQTERTTFDPDCYDHISEKVAKAVGQNYYGPENDELDWRERPTFGPGENYVDVKVDKFDRLSTLAVVMVGIDTENLPAAPRAERNTLGSISSDEYVVSPSGLFVPSDTPSSPRPDKLIVPSGSLEIIDDQSWDEHSDTVGSAIYDSLRSDQELWSDFMLNQELYKRAENAGAVLGVLVMRYDGRWIADPSA